jgi:hypothetical protein
VLGTWLNDCAPNYRAVSQAFGRALLHKALEELLVGVCGCDVTLGRIAASVDMVSVMLPFCEFLMTSVVSARSLLDSPLTLRQPAAP